MSIEVTDPNELRLVDAELPLQGGVASPLGFSAGGGRGGIKTEGDDVALIVSDRPAVAAAVFTRNLVKAAPVLVCAEHAAQPLARAIIANAGNANCCTGLAGLASARAMCDIAAAKIGCRPEEVLVCSTGIIGHQLEVARVAAAVAQIELRPTPAEAGAELVATREAASEAAARAVMTTDLVPKYCAAWADIAGGRVTVGGLAKGVGMIGPDMGPALPHATLLSFLTTDAAVDKAMLQRALEGVVEKSYNSVTVDGDTSTNDTCILLANGASGVVIDEAHYEEFRALLETVCVELAKRVARDGEGATKLVTVEVGGAATAAEAKAVAMTIANSPLVKTAIFGCDPNWGRIAAAAGRAGVRFDAARLTIRLGQVEVFRDGAPTDFSGEHAQWAMAGHDLTIQVELGAGSASWRAWTCDFSYDYVKINAEYHT